MVVFFLAHRSGVELAYEGYTGIPHRKPRERTQCNLSGGRELALHPEWCDNPGTTPILLDIPPGWLVRTMSGFRFRRRRNLHGPTG